MLFRSIGTGPGGAVISSSPERDQKEIKGWATAALILGILAFPATILYFVPGLVCAILAMVFGNMAIRSMKNDHSSQDTFAWNAARAGKTLGIVWLCLILLVLLILIIILAAAIGGSGFFWF